MFFQSNLKKILSLLDSSNQWVFLTGAGMSVDSGIPTFRGPGGLWNNKKAPELAKLKTFLRDSQIVWEFYASRIMAHKQTQPNNGHFALAQIETFAQDSGKSFHLITQNVDNLHRRSGIQSLSEIHGNISFLRCTNKKCQNQVPKPIPPILESIDDLMICQSCSSLNRPHVLWFDEFYDNSLYDVSKAVDSAAAADILFVIGTNLMTSLPRSITYDAIASGKHIVEINTESVLMSEFATARNVHFFQGTATDILTQVAKHLE